MSKVRRGIARTIRSHDTDFRVSGVAGDCFGSEEVGSASDSTR